jgi:hypothetical protein
VAGIREVAEKVGGARLGHAHFRDAKRSPKYALSARTSCSFCLLERNARPKQLHSAGYLCAREKGRSRAGSRRSLGDAYPSFSVVEGWFDLDDGVVDHKRRDGSNPLSPVWPYLRSIHHRNGVSRPRNG